MLCSQTWREAPVITLELAWLRVERETFPLVAGLAAETEFAGKLRALLSPEEVDARAKKRQAEQLERHGGRRRRHRQKIAAIPASASILLRLRRRSREPSPVSELAPWERVLSE